MTTFFNYVDWSGILSGINADEQYELFLVYYKRACEQFIPLSKHYPRKPFSGAFIALVHRKHKA